MLLQKKPAGCCYRNNGGWSSQWRQPWDNRYLIKLRVFAGNHPGLNIVSGLVSLRAIRLLMYTDKIARKIDASGIYYDHFNSAFKMIPQISEIYHKSKLVPVLKCNSLQVSGNWQKKFCPIWAEHYGLRSRKQDLLQHSSTGQVVAPVICYESFSGISLQIM